MPSLKDTTRIRSLLLHWYQSTARAFPWRVDNVDPYVVMVSEIMLQQTQATRVAELLPQFLHHFPNLEILAGASNAQIITAWKGLGYNNRALRLRDAAQAIVKEYGSTVPSDIDVLRSLPGIGPYASAAICTFAFNTYTIVIDVNVRRVYSRLRAKQADTSQILSEHEIREFGITLVPEEQSSVWHHAVMDLGATICKARRAECDACPLCSVCPSAGLASTLTTPLPRRTKPEPMFRKQPRRIWRGRVVAELIAHPNGLQTEDLIALVFGSVDAEETSAVEVIITALEKDNLINITSSTISLLH